MHARSHERQIFVRNAPTLGVEVGGGRLREFTTMSSTNGNRNYEALLLRRLGAHCRPQMRGCARRQDRS